ncbi:hypothetical protein COL5a_007068 [Colletotrichum fioriniae]|nr:hypothetical protein COL5a_007068 [Colletotrichum fioriniae]
MDRLRRLLVHHNHHLFQRFPTETTKPSSPDNASPIQCLPNEILYQILALLQLHDEFALSHTCKDLRALTHRDWILALVLLPRNHKLAFWTGLAYTKPNHWVCSPCCHLHRICTQDIPGDKNYNPFSCQQNSRHVFSQRQYKLRHAHVQLALKLTRMGNGGGLDKNQQRLLQNIMAPFASRANVPTSLTSTASAYAVTPKIVDGRFLIHVEHEVRDDPEASFLLLRMTCSRRVCPHLMILLEPNSQVIFDDDGVNINQWLGWGHTRYLSRYMASSDVMDGIRVAVDGHGYESIGHCQRCAMDYTIIASHGTVMLHSWHDLGAYGSPESDEWMVHIQTAENDSSRGPTVYHESGSVQEMYLEG